MNAKYNAVWKKRETLLKWYNRVHPLVLLRVSARLRIPRQTLSRTLHAEGLYHYHIQRIKHLEPTGMVSRSGSCLSNADRHIIRIILPTDETDLTRCGVKITEPPINETIIIHVGRSKVSTNIAFP